MNLMPTKRISLVCVQKKKTYFVQFFSQFTTLVLVILLKYQASILSTTLVMFDKPELLL